MREIPLTQGKVAIVDDQDYERLAGYNWWAERKATVYGERWYAKRYEAGRTIRMHNDVAGYLGADHLDCNGLNNRRGNLRRANHQQNGGNRRKSGGCLTSQFKGVSWDKAQGKWTANIRVNFVQRFLGRYDDETDAARAYDAAATSNFGEFARPNFV